MLLLSTGPETPLGIVDTTILKAFLDIVPEDAASRLLAEINLTPPEFDDPRYAVWIKACRAKYGDTQKEFAHRINTYGLSLCDSDIGNLENNLRKDHYGLTRRREITSIVHLLYQPQTKNQT